MQPKTVLVKDVTTASRKKEKFSIVLLSLFGTFPLSIFGAYLGLHLDDIGTLAIIISILLALRNVFQIFLRVPLGHFSQIVGRRPVLLMGITCYFLSLFTLSFAFHWGVVLISVFFIAVGMSAFWPIMFAYVGDIEKTNIGKMQGRIFQASDIGTLFGALFAYLLLKELTVSLNILFIWSSLITLVGLIILVFYLPEVLPESDRQQVESKIRALFSSFYTMLKDIIYITKQKKLRLIYLYQLVISFFEYVMTAFMPFLIVAKGFTKDTVAELLWITALALMLFKPLMGSIIDKLGFKVPVTTTLFLSATTLVLFVMTDNFILLLLVYMLYNASTLTAYLGVNTTTIRLSKPTERGIALGALGFYVSLGRSFSTIALAPVWTILGLEAVFLTTAIIVILCAIVLLFTAKGLDLDKKEKIKDVSYD